MLKAKCINSEIIVNEFEDREILYAFHDIDGTHSLIRDWPPVMSICLYDVIEKGLADDFDSLENTKRLINLAGTKPLEETDRFCVESAGLSALTQMEWAIRRSVEEDKIEVNCDKNVNSEIIKRIWKGEEIFDDLPETDEMKALLTEKTPRLFKLYEAVLNGFCRDKNLEKAKKNPLEFQVRGSMEFMKFLKELGMDSKKILVVGDGRAEISAGAELGSVVLSRLPETAAYQRNLHEELGTNIIVKDYYCKDLFEILK